VVAPIKPKLEWDRVKEFTRLLAEFLVRAQPDLFTATISKDKRTGKIFVDYLRNSETASAVSAYSARARKDAGVSTPLEWEELGRADLRERFTVLTVPKRLARLTLDPWAEYASSAQSITDAMWKALGSK
jgi:bifunctional non-homologous end joining protein LigD